MTPLPVAYFITWTTYGTWMPGDARGWRKEKAGDQPPQPRLEAWCRQQMLGQPVVLNEPQRRKVEEICRKHAAIRNWTLHALSVRSNHVHLVVSAAAAPKLVRDQFKANSTRVLRQSPDAIKHQQVWTGGGDIEFIDRDGDLENVVVYVMEAQDRMGRDS